MQSANLPPPFAPFLLFGPAHLFFPSLASLATFRVDLSWDLWDFCSESFKAFESSENLRTLVLQAAMLFTHIYIQYSICIYACNCKLYILCLLWPLEVMHCAYFDVV